MLAFASLKNPVKTECPNLLSNEFAVVAKGQDLCVPPFPLPKTAKC